MHMCMRCVEASLALQEAAADEEEVAAAADAAEISNVF